MINLIFYLSLCQSVKTNLFLTILKDFIEKLPMVNVPGVFGLHTNAEIMYNVQAVEELWINLSNIHSKESNVLFF